LDRAGGDRRELRLPRRDLDLVAAREAADIVVASFHWGLHKDVLDYMKEIAHFAIDAGADGRA
jgi:poly-gamma-glutamate capsule biosynthesis protein CapA/YwtB (metallophosphatase superfamily)